MNLIEALRKLEECPNGYIKEKNGDYELKFYALDRLKDTERRLILVASGNKNPSTNLSIWSDYWGFKKVLGVKTRAFTLGEVLSDNWDYYPVNNSYYSGSIGDHKFKCGYCGHYYDNVCDCNGYEDNYGR